MPVKNSSLCNFGWKPENFNLISVDEQYYNLNSILGANGLVVAFICNHCPYVISISERLSFESNQLAKIGINTVAIMSNDVEAYPEDSYSNMKKFSHKYNFKFPYLYDSDQKVAKNFEAVCTPDFFGFNKKLELQYRGRIDSGIMKDNSKIITRELYEAMTLVSKTMKGPKTQNNSLGCSIKWKKNE